MATIIHALSFKTERDIVLVNVLSALLILIIIFFPNAPVRIMLGLPFVLLFPGYVSISALFPRKGELDIIERLAFSIGLSTAITPLIGLLLNYTTFGIRIYSVMLSLFSFILLVSIVAIYRRRTISPGDMFAPLGPDRDRGEFDAVHVEENNEEAGYKVKSETGFTGIFNKIKLEYLALPLFIAISLFVYHQKYFSYIFMVIAAAIGALIFIVFNKYFAKREEPISSFELPDDKSRRLRLVTSILFFIFYGLSFLTLLQGFYTKTVWYYIFISLCAGVIAVEILFVKTKNQGMLNLLKSFLLVLNITLSSQILFSYGCTTGDFGIHHGFLVNLINNGYVPEMWGYERFPCHHILAAANILICGSDTSMTYRYLGGFLISFGMLFVFLIGKNFVNLKFGLFVALIYACLDYFIMYGSHPEHNSYNYFFSIMLFAVILDVHKYRDARFIVLYPIVIITIVFVHHYSAIAVLIALSSLIVVEIIQRIKKSDYKFRSPRLIQLFGVILFAQWMYYSNMMGSFVGIIEVYSDAFAMGTESFIEATAYDQLSITTLFLNTLGSSILIVLSVIGFLYFFKKRSFFNMFVIVATIIISILLAIGVVLEYYVLLADRMYPYLQIFGLVFLGSAGIIWICNIGVKHNKLKLISVITLIMCLAFFSHSSTIAGFETSLFVDEDTAYFKRYGTSHETYFSQWEASNIENTYLFSMDNRLEEDLNKRRIGLTGKLKKEFEGKGFALPENPGALKEENNQWIIIDITNRHPWHIVIKEKGKLNVYKITVTIGLPITRNGSIDVQNVTGNSFIIFNKFYLKTGFIRAAGSHLGQHHFITIKEDKLYVLERYSKYYDNGMVDLYYKPKELL